MKAITVNEHGSAAVLQYGEMPRPTPAAGQIRLKVALTSVNFADIKARKGAYGEREMPFVPGLDAAGVVDAVGKGVSEFEVGQRVGAYTLGGSYAEYALTNSQLCFALPEAVSFEQGAAIGILITAYNVLTLAGRINEGESVLVHAGAGGVGSTLIRLAKSLGASRIFATAGSEEKLELLTTLGADHAINYRAGDFAETVNTLSEGAGVDLILDAISGDNAERSMSCLAPFGRLVIYGHTGSGEAAIGSKALHKQNRGVMGYSSGGFRNARPEVIKRAGETVLELLAQNKVDVLLGKKFALQNAAQAQTFVESRKSVGKVLLEP